MLAVPVWLRWVGLLPYVLRSRRVPGWTRGSEALALALVSYRLPEGAVVVEIGSFLGSSAILLAGARKLRGSGRVHCVDPFDGAGDPYSAPLYAAAQRELGQPLREAFDQNVRRAGLSAWVDVHVGTAEEVAQRWSAPVDLLFLDGSHEAVAARRAHDAWAPFLRPGGTLAVHNSCPGAYDPGHDGSFRLVTEVVTPPRYRDVRLIGTTTFANVADGQEDAGHRGSR